jgi:hypothetical protein
MIADWDLNESGTMNLTGFLGMISALTDCFDTERELYKGEHTTERLQGYRFACAPTLFTAPTAV